MTEPTDTNDYTKDDWLAQFETDHRFNICLMPDEAGSLGSSVVEGCEVVVDVSPLQARRIGNMLAAAPELVRALSVAMEHMQTNYATEGERLRMLRNALWLGRQTLRWATRSADLYDFGPQDEYEDDRLCAEIENAVRDAQACH